MKFKLIVTHINPDLDAVASVWLLRKFNAREFGDAEVYFVPAGERISEETLEAKELSPDEVVHVDTGLGKFDHHTRELASRPVCAASLVRDELVELYPDLEEDDALARMIDFFVEIDHFKEVFWPEPNADRYLFQLDEVLHHLKDIGVDDTGVVTFASKALDSVYAAFKVRVAAEKEVKEGIEFETPWGKGLGLETANDEVIKFAQKAGYSVVVRKDPQKGNVRIKAVPEKDIDLTEAFEAITAREPKATWYLHPAKTMLLNGSSKHINQVASKLTLREVIDILERTMAK